MLKDSIDTVRQRFNLRRMVISGRRLNRLSVQETHEAGILESVSGFLVGPFDHHQRVNFDIPESVQTFVI